MKRLGLLCALLAAVAGCGGAATRAWQRSAMPTHDRQAIFDAAREVLAAHFEIADSSFASGTIETKPQVFERQRAGTLADVRGAGGRWRRTASFAMDYDGLTVIARVAVRLEREATAAAVAVSEAAGETGDELPGPAARRATASARASEEVWMEVGYDDGLARELLAAIAERARQAAHGEELPKGQSPKDAAEETRRIGAQQR